jgi:hypothetical protein
MAARTNLGTALAALGLLGTSLACELDGTACTDGSGTEHLVYALPAYVLAALAVPNPDGTASVPRLAIDVQGYPYNRIVVSAAAVPAASDGAGPGTPIALMPGTRFKTTLLVGAFARTYGATLVAGYDLPEGSYLLEAPGLVLDAQMAQTDNPGAPMTLSLPGSAFAAALPTGSPFVPLAQGLAGTLTLTLDFAGDGTTAWTDLTVIPKKRNQSQASDRL